MKYCTLLSIVVVALAFISGNALRINKVSKIFKSTRPRLIENIVIGSLIAWTCFDGVSLKVGDSNTIGVQSVHSVSAAETSLFAGKLYSNLTD